MDRAIRCQPLADYPGKARQSCRRSTVILAAIGVSVAFGKMNFFDCPAAMFDGMRRTGNGDGSDRFPAPITRNQYQLSRRSGKWSFPSPACSSDPQSLNGLSSVAMTDDKTKVLKITPEGQL
jgi:hypothetical protein